MLYVGPLAAGAALPFHLSALGQFGEIGWSQIAGLPGVLEGELNLITSLAIAGWLAAIGWSVSDYAEAMSSGYRLLAAPLLARWLCLVRAQKAGLRSFPFRSIAINPKLPTSVNSEVGAGICERFSELDWGW